jgi:hypothetical protein
VPGDGTARRLEAVHSLARGSDSDRQLLGDVPYPARSVPSDDPQCAEAAQRQCALGAQPRVDGVAQLGLEADEHDEQRQQVCHGSPSPFHDSCFLASSVQRNMRSAECRSPFLRIDLVVLLVMRSMECIYETRNLGIRNDISAHHPHRLPSVDHEDGTPHPTGFWAREFMEAYTVFTDGGLGVDVTTPGGVSAQVDELSYAGRLQRQRPGLRRPPEDVP